MPSSPWISLTATLFFALSSVSASAMGEEPVSAPASPPPSCRLGDHSGIEGADAQTATRLVCDQIDRAGASGGAAFVVDVERLGSLIILTVTREGAPGAPPDERDIRLHRIEDVPSAAPRLATAIIHATAVEDMEIVHPVEPSPSPARVHVALGIIGQFPPLERSALPTPGVDAEVSVEADPIDLVAGIRGGADAGNEGVTMGFAAFSMGARYFTGRASTSPYLGGGFAWSYETMIDHSSAFFKGSHSGLGAYVEAGVAFFHTHRADIEIGARVDLPFYSLTPDSIVETVTTRPDGTQMVNESLPAPIYYLPLSLELRVRF